MILQRLILVAVCAASLTLAGCGRPQRTPEQVAGPIAPHDLRLGPTPSGGPSESATGAGAGGSAAAGYEAGRIAGQPPHPVTPAYAPGFMAPNGTSGSGLGDRGHPIPPEQPIVPLNNLDVTQPLSVSPPQLPPNVRG